MLRLGKNQIVKIIVLMNVISIIFTNFPHITGVIANSSYNEAGLAYTGYATFYVKENNSFKVEFKPLDRIFVTVRPSGYKVNVTLTPLPLEEFKEYYIILLKHSYIISPSQPNNFTAADLYKKHLINQVKSNSTFAQILYSKYLKAVGINTVSTVYYLSKDNYVTNFPEVGFFPLYSVKPLTPKVIDKEKPVYFGYKIKDEGIRSIGVSSINLSGFFLELKVDNFVISGDGSPITVDLLFKKNYFVYGSGIFLPVNKTTYVLLNLEPTNETMRFLDTVPGYNILGPDYTLPLIISGVVIGVGAVGFAVWRRRR